MIDPNTPVQIDLGEEDEPADWPEPSKDPVEEPAEPWATEENGPSK